MIGAHSSLSNGCAAFGVKVDCAHTTRSTPHTPTGGEGNDGGGTLIVILVLAALATFAGVGFLIHRRKRAAADVSMTFL
jgi:hypothetical protein